MGHLIVACSCGVDPATETMVVQTGLALAVSAPFWFRAQIVKAAQRLRGGPTPSDGCASAGEDEPQSG